MNRKRNASSISNRSSSAIISKRCLAWLFCSVLMIQIILFSAESPEPETTWKADSTSKPPKDGSTVSTNPSNTGGHNNDGDAVTTGSGTESSLKEIQPTWNENSSDGIALPLNTWREWLGQDLVVSEEFEDGSFPSTLPNWCGFSVFLRFGGVSFQRAFMKHASGIRKSQIMPWNAETHLREIKAAYLDRILGTELVPACVGHRIHTNDVQPALQQILNGDTHCADKDGLLEGSAMFYVKGLQRVTKRSLVNANLSPDSSEFVETARRYALFNYMAGCAKSAHNHFALNRTRVVAIDNDRCFTPNEVLERIPDRHFNRYRIWAEVVFQTCRFPESFVKLLESTVDGESVGDRLRRALLDDALSADLLKEQPEVFQEIDERASRLFHHIQTKCQDKANS